MIDFPILYESGTPHWAWTICGVGYYLIFALYYRRMVNNALWMKTPTLAKNSLFFLIFVFSICAIYTGDFSHYQFTVKTEESIDHLEKIYQWIIRAVDHNYLIFRTLLWGGGVVLLFFSFKEFEISPHRSLFYLFASYITFYSYTRAGVAQAVFFCGFSLFFNKEKKTLLIRLLGLLLLLLSYFFHRSILALIVFTPLCFIPVNKNTFPVYLLSTIFIFSIANRLLGNAMAFLMEYEDYSEALEIYTNTRGGYIISSTNSLIAIITYYLGKAIFHVPFWFCVISILKYQEKINYNIQAIFRISLALYVFVIIMLFSFGSASAFYYRYERMLVIPITVMVNYLYQEKIFSLKRYRFFILVGALLMCWEFFYRIFFT